MKKSVNLYFNTNVDTKLKLDAIKEAGYDEFFTGINVKDETMSLKKQCKYAKKIGLGCTMIHCTYNSDILDHFWLEDKIGDQICKNYMKQIKKAHKFTKNFVIHLHGDDQSTVSKIGLERLQKLIKLCEKYDINLCVENLYSEVELPYIFKHIKSKHLKMCVDYGHMNFLTPHADFIDKFNHLISVVHIHDNNGNKDAHKMIGKGKIDWDNVAQGLTHKPNLTLSSEIKYSNNKDYKGVLKENLQGLEYLDNLIQKYKKSE